MIRLHRLRGEVFALNPDLFERVEETPDTTITLVDGSKYVVKETLEEVMVLIQEFRAAVIRISHQMEEGTYTHPEPDGPETGATIINLPRRGN